MVSCPALKAEATPVFDAFRLAHDDGNRENERDTGHLAYCGSGASVIVAASRKKGTDDYIHRPRD
jgi:hypothetical protein